MNDVLYGKLYNHYAVTDSRGLCPTGWHVPSDAECAILVNYLGGMFVAGGALKSTAIQPSTVGWLSPNSGATNSSGYTASPGGRRLFNGNYQELTVNGYWWSTTIQVGALDRELVYNSSQISSAPMAQSIGMSVRCLKD